jgi:hypothetical protein
VNGGSTCFYQVIHVFSPHFHYHFPVLESALMLVQDNDETIFLQSKDSPLLAEHNLLCEAFSITTSFLGYDLFSFGLLP